MNEYLLDNQQNWSCLKCNQTNNQQDHFCYGCKRKRADAAVEEYLRTDTDQRDDLDESGLCQEEKEKEDDGDLEDTDERIYYNYIQPTKRFEPMKQLQNPFRSTPCSDDKLGANSEDVEITQESKFSLLKIANTLESYRSSIKRLQTSFINQILPGILPYKCDLCGEDKIPHLEEICPVCKHPRDCPGDPDTG